MSYDLIKIKKNENLKTGSRLLKCFKNFRKFFEREIFAAHA